MSETSDSTDSPAKQISLKPSAVIDDNFNFIINGKFAICAYNFPPDIYDLPGIISMNSWPLPDALETVDVMGTMRQVAQKVGNGIVGAFHQTPPNNVLAAIAQKFEAENPIVLNNFMTLKESRTDLNEFIDLKECLHKQLYRWKRARASCLKRKLDGNWQYREGRAYGKLTQAYKERITKMKELQNETKKKRLLAKAKLDGNQQFHSDQADATLTQDCKERITNQKELKKETKQKRRSAKAKLAESEKEKAELRKKIQQFDQLLAKANSERDEAIRQNNTLLQLISDMNTKKLNEQAHLY